MNEKPHYQAWIHLAKTWEKDITPPARPCKNQLKIYRQILERITRKAKKPRVLILGATPELRDLCLENNFKVTVCDINPVMVEGMSSLMKHHNKFQEKIVIIDWLKMDFPQSSYDIIMGDASLNQILKIKELEHLLKKINYILKPDGLLLLREVIRVNPKPIIKSHGWKRWFKKYKQNKISFIDLYSFYKYQSDANSYCKSPSLIDFLPVLKKIKRLEKEGKVDKFFTERIEKIFGKKSKQLLVFVKKDLEKLLSKYFDLLPIRQCRDYQFCKYMLLILARSKK